MIGIKKTKMNIFWLLVFGFIIGIVMGLRSPMPKIVQPTHMVQGVQK